MGRVRLASLYRRVDMRRAFIVVIQTYEVQGEMACGAGRSWFRLLLTRSRNGLSVRALSRAHRDVVRALALRIR